MHVLQPSIINYVSCDLSSMWSSSDDAQNIRSWCPMICACMHLKKNCVSVWISSHEPRLHTQIQNTDFIAPDHVICACAWYYCEDVCAPCMSLQIMRALCTTQTKFCAWTVSLLRRITGVHPSLGMSLVFIHPLACLWCSACPGMYWNVNLHAHIHTKYTQPHTLTSAHYVRIFNRWITYVSFSMSSLHWIYVHAYMFACMHTGTNEVQICTNACL